jgi:hypothetical protein
VGSDDNAPTALGTFNDVPSLVRFGDGLPTPQAIAAAVVADASPRVRAKGIFANADEARRFAAAWPNILQRYRSATLLLGLSKLLDDIKLEQKDATVELVGQLPEAQTRLGLTLLRALLPPPPPELIPNPPPPPTLPSLPSQPASEPSEPSPATESPASPPDLMTAP